MKKMMLLAVMMVMVMAFAQTSVAMVITAGDFRMTTSDWSVFDDPIPPGGPVPASGNLWGIFRIDTISDSLGNLTWQSGQGGEYLAGVMGGLTLHADGNAVTGYHVSIPGIGYVPQALINIGVPHYAYFTPAVAQVPYLQVFLSSTEDFIGNAAAGYESGPGGGLGAFGSFGGNILAGTPWLSATFDAPALVFDDAGLPFGADGLDLYRANTLSTTTVQTTAYLDVDPTVGVGALLDTNSMLAGSDVKITATVDFRVPANFNGWNGQSSGQAFGNAVPVPASLLLLGSGLVGLAGLGRRFKR